MHLDPERHREEVVVPGTTPVRLSVIDVGPARPRGTLLFVHGFGGAARQWSPLVPHFAGEYRVIVPDLRGHGPSSSPPGPYTVPRLVADLEEVLAQRGVTGTVCAVGHSFGGAIAAEFAVRHPERVDRLVLICTAVTFRFAPLPQVLLRLPDRVLEWYRLRFAPLFHSPARAARRFFKESVQRFDGTVYGKITVPTLVIRGRWDFLFPEAAFSAVARLVPGARELVLPVAAHLVHVKQPEAVRRAIDRFLRE